MLLDFIFPHLNGRLVQSNGMFTASMFEADYGLGEICCVTQKENKDMPESPLQRGLQCS